MSRQTADRAADGRERVTSLVVAGRNGVAHDWSLAERRMRGIVPIVSDAGRAARRILRADRFIV